MYEEDEFDSIDRRTAGRSGSYGKRAGTPRPGDTASQRSTNARLNGSTARLPTVKSRGTLRRDDADVTRPQASQKAASSRENPSRSSAHSQSARSGAQRHSSNPQPPQRVKRGVPVVAVILVAILFAGIGAGVTYLVLQGQVAQAKKDAASAQSQASTLSQQIAQMQTNNTSEESSEDGESSSSDDSGSSNNSSSSKSTAGVEDPWLSSGKLFTSGDSVLDQEVKAFCDSKADTSMDLETASYNVYTGIAWSEYVERDDAQNPSGPDWRTEYARKYYEHDCSGNCYEFAAFLSFCLQYLGYSDAHAEGVLVELQSGGWGDHGVVFVTSADGVESYCDTARGTNGWMLPVGTYNLKLQDFENA
ncbi:MAG: hypothetical protein Q4B54_00910 [Coriobacteriales bacterium]|nr:hypothetical protein [Coriobacteriales bacterium]